MRRTEKVADTLAHFRQPDKPTQHRDMCRQIADDMGLGGADREEFLRKSKAFES